MNATNVDAPDLTPGYPSKGKRLGPAWRAAWAELLKADKPLDGWALAEKIAPEYDMEPLSIVQLLSRMAAGDILEREQQPVEVPIRRTRSGVTTAHPAVRMRSHYRIKRDG